MLMSSSVALREETKQVLHHQTTNTQIKCKWKSSYTHVDRYIHVQTSNKAVLLVQRSEIPTT